MHFHCLTPTYGRPSLIQNTLALFQAQALRRGDRASLYVLDDAGQLDPQTWSSACGSKTVQVFARHTWLPLPTKYGVLLGEIGIQADPDAVYVVWDDDDVYLPWHLVAIADALQGTPGASWTHPSVILSTYDTDPLAGQLPREESSAGRFHGALAVRGDLLAEVGGWPQTLEATYDQQMLGRLRATGPAADPIEWHDASYVYRWADTGKWHCSGTIDAGQYRQPPIQEPGRMPGRITPMFDRSTRALLTMLHRAEA
jgi:hypothetical protein